MTSRSPARTARCCSRACVERGLDVFGFNTNGNTPFHRPLFHFLRNHKTDVVYTTVIGQFCEAVGTGRDRRAAERGTGGTRRRRIQGDPAAEDRPAADARAEPGILRLRRRTGSKTPARRVGGKPAAVRGVVAGRRRFRQGDAGRRRPDAVRWRTRRSRGAAASTGERIGSACSIDDDTRIITCVARLHPLKGLDNLLLAAREVLASMPPDAAAPEARIGLAADGPAAEISRLRRGGDVRFVFAGQGGELAAAAGDEP